MHFSEIPLRLRINPFSNPQFNTFILFWAAKLLLLKVVFSRFQCLNWGWTGLIINWHEWTFIEKSDGRDGGTNSREHTQSLPFLCAFILIITECDATKENAWVENCREEVKSTGSLSMPCDVIWFLSSKGNKAIFFPRLSNVWEWLWMGEWACQRLFGTLSVSVTETAPKAHNWPSAFD